MNMSGAKTCNKFPCGPVYAKWEGPNKPPTQFKYRFRIIMKASNNGLYNYDLMELECKWQISLKKRGFKLWSQNQLKADGNIPVKNTPVYSQLLKDSNEI